MLHTEHVLEELLASAILQMLPSFLPYGESSENDKLITVQISKLFLDKMSASKLVGVGVSVNYVKFGVLSVFYTVIIFGIVNT
jgi:hypothetical protein